MSDIRRHNRTTFIGTENAFGDAESEVRLTEQLGNAKCAVHGRNNVGKRITEEVIVQDEPSPDESNMEELLGSRRVVT